uniref:Uncharacterized protein n=1 Tax=Arion vulgaris TaxID=1028688 RepID=A0A0B7BAM9_9EUPU
MCKEENFMKNNSRDVSTLKGKSRMLIADTKHFLIIIKCMLQKEEALARRCKMQTFCFIRSKCRENKVETY